MTSSKPFPLEVYVFVWLVICVVAAEGIHDLVDGVLGSGIVLLGLVPVMVWLMHFRPRRLGQTDRADRPRGRRSRRADDE